MQIENKKILHTDILIIGGGTAGCYAALTIREQSDYSIVIAEKANIKRSGCLAAGVNAINAYIVDGRKPEDYVEYAKKDADGIVREDLLMTMSEGLNRVTHKMENLGLVILKDENGKVCGVQVAKMELGEMDESGRASCHEVKDSLFTMDCDLVAMAIGQKVDFTPLNNDLKTTDTHASTLENVFIIGDAFTGPKTIGSAVMEGKKIAKEIEAKYNEGTK